MISKEKMEFFEQFLLTDCFNWDEEKSNKSKEYGNYIPEKYVFFTVLTQHRYCNSLEEAIDIIYDRFINLEKYEKEEYVYREKFIKNYYPNIDKIPSYADKLFVNMLIKTADEHFKT